MKILIVDDKDEDLYLLETLLKGNGYEVASAKNGVEALEMLKIDAIGIIISDILMPKMDGYQLCRKCKSDDMLRKIPFVFYTATYTDKKDEEFALSLGANKFIIKPVAPDAFLKILENVIKEHEKGTLVAPKRSFEKEEVYLKQYNERLIQKLEKKMLDLEKDITKRRQAEAKIQHLNLVLRTIRNVNQLIVEEKNRDVLIQKVCEILTENRGYANAWLVLLGKQGEYLNSTEVGLGKSFTSMRKMLKQGKLVDCGNKAMKKKDVVIIEDPAEECVDCPLSANYTGRGGYSICIRHGGNIYGLLTVSVVADFIVKDKEEQDLFRELGGDIGFALHSLEVEKKRKQTEEELQESEQRFRRLLYTAKDAIIEMDEKGCISIWNVAATEMFGFTKSEVIGKELHTLLAPERYHKKAQEGVKKFLKTGIGTVVGKTLELVALRKDGTEFSVELSISSVKSGNTWQATGIMRDITERKRAEEEIRMFAHTIKSINDCVNIANLDNYIIFVNKTFCDVYGYSQEDILGKNTSILWSSLTPEEFTREILPQTLKGGWHGEIYNKRKDGSNFTVYLSTSVIRDENGEPIALVGVSRDITEQKRAQEDKEQLQAQLRQAQKMEAIGTLAGGIADDFNNMLSAILGYVEMALFDLPEVSQTRSDLEEVMKAGNRAKDLVQQILTFSRVTEQERKPMKLHHIIKDALKLLRSSLPMTIEIRQDIDMKCGAVLADPTQINQVVMNLCTNAYHAMREHGGVLEVKLETAPVDAEFAKSNPYLHAGDYLKLTVSDTGHGMDEATKERIFDPFFTTKAVGEGTGMGLSVVHGIVKSHGGAISLASEPGKGTTFNIYLPQIDRAIAPKIRPAESVPGGNEYILFVDDEEPLVHIGKRMLERLGYKVMVKTSSIEALEAFRKEPDRFNLIITDQTMPNMTGVELAGKLLHIRPDVPIILMTGFSEMVTPETAKNIGIHEYIMKPIITLDLGNAIRRALHPKIEKET